MIKKRWMVVLVALPGCIRDAGECWVRGEEEGGVGGGVVVGAGAGGFGDVPPEPQGAPAPADPCVQAAECEVTWTSGSEGCQSSGPGSTCRTYYQGQHRSLEEAKAACERAMGVGKSSNVKSCDPCYWVETTDHKQECVRMFDACQDKGPPCDKQIDNGKTLCAFCLDDCIGKREYKYSDCYECGFK